MKDILTGCAEDCVDIEKDKKLQVKIGFFLGASFWQRNFHCNILSKLETKTKYV